MLTEQSQAPSWSSGPQQKVAKALFLRFIGACALIFGLVCPVWANGAWSEFRTGGVVFKSEDKVSMLREDLEIGLDRIQVRYIFNNTAGEPLEKTIGFPMAKVPQDDTPDNLQERSWAQEGQDVRNYMAFSISVNGKPLVPKLHEYAWLGDVPVTDRLRELGAPVFAATVDSYVALAQLPVDTVNRLIEEKLALPVGTNWLVPQWQYQTVYEWTQHFEPGQTEVEISYRPLYGSPYEPFSFRADGPENGAYCHASVIKEIAALREQGIQPESLTVGYILRTAGYWEGPIGIFNLKIRKKEDDIVSFCAPEGLERSPDGAYWSARDFSPGSDLNILFLTQSPVITP